MEDLIILNAAYRDVKTNAVPYRNEQGEYHPAPGQRDILNQAKFQQITTLNVQIEQQEKKAKSIRRDMLAFDQPSGKIISNNQDEKANYQPDIEEEKDYRRQLQAARRQYTENVMTRGYIPRQAAAPVTAVVPPAKPKWYKEYRNEIRNGVLSWAAGEIFMTVTQFSSLQYYRSLDNILVRSLAFAVVLFIFHYTSHLYKKS